MISLGVDLSFYNGIILGGQSNSIDWYLDAGLTNLVPDPTNQDVADGDVFMSLYQTEFVRMLQLFIFQW